APRRSRGAVTGIFYVACYLGFGLPVLLTTIEPSVGIVAPMIVLAIVAAGASAARAIRLQRTA
ncbi:MFS transporter, partial [Streptomyces sp. SID10244]|nr:MFS transporter [Streptomyces sp. SID10244]